MSWKMATEGKDPYNLIKVEVKTGKWNLGYI